MCVSVSLRERIFISLTEGSEEKGGDVCGDYSGTLSKPVEYLCVLHGRVYVQCVCVCVTTAACVRTAVGETSCRARQHSRKQCTPFDSSASVSVYLVNVRVCVHGCSCVLTGFTSRQSILSVTRKSWADGADLKKDRQPTKSLVLYSHRESHILQ